MEIRKMLPYLLIFSGIFALIGAVSTCWAVYRIREGLVAARWPTLPAVVKSFEVEDHWNVGSRNTAGSITREVKVTYGFTLNGVSYDGTRIHPMFVAPDATDCLTDLRQKLAPGNSVRVHYDPGNPRRSTLTTGFFAVSLMPLVIGLMFVGMGLGFGTAFYAAIAGDRDYANRIELIESTNGDHTGG